VGLGAGRYQLSEALVMNLNSTNGVPGTSSNQEKDHG
jgi:hypothetical protein